MICFEQYYLREQNGVITLTHNESLWTRFYFTDPVQAGGWWNNNSNNKNNDSLRLNSKTWDEEIPTTKPFRNTLVDDYTKTMTNRFEDVERHEVLGRWKQKIKELDLEIQQTKVETRKLQQKENQLFRKLEHMANHVIL